MLFIDDGFLTFNWTLVTDSQMAVGEFAGFNLWESLFSASQVWNVYTDCLAVSLGLSFTFSLIF